MPPTTLFRQRTPATTPADTCRPISQTSQLTTHQIHFAAPMHHRTFAVSHPNGNTISPSLAYPLRKPLIPTYASAILSTLLPFILILLMHPRARSLATTATALLGLLHALLLSTLAQVTLKPLLAAPRPHFLTICDPATPPYGSQSGAGFGQIIYDRRVCRGAHGAVSEALKSFPSGTATAAFAGLGFLALYFNAQLRVFGNVRAGALKMLAVWVSLLGAALLAGARFAAGWNHWYDVVAGAGIGLVAAVAAYRGCFASVWDLRFNCVPLVKGVGFRYGVGRQEGFDVREETDAHGNVHEHLGGAPFDALIMPGPAVGGDDTAAATAGSVPAREERRKERVPRKAVGTGLFRRGDENV